MGCAGQDGVGRVGIVQGPRVPSKIKKKIFSPYGKNQDIWISNTGMFHRNTLVHVGETLNRFADLRL